MVTRLLGTVLAVLICVGAGTGQEKVDAGTSRPATASHPAATQPTAPRVLLREDFESGRGKWGGTVISDNLPAGSKYGLAAVPTETHWARRATVGMGRSMRAGADTVLTFRYRVSRDIPVTIYIMNRTQKDNLRYDIDKPVRGQWTDVTLNVNKDFRRNDGSAGRLQPGDFLTSVSFLAGKTGRDEFDLAVDDVCLVARE